MPKGTKNSIVLDEQQPSNFLPVVMGHDRVNAMIESNLGGDELTPGDLDRAVNPSGKNIKWELPDVSGDSESISELSGVIVHSCSKRVYYKDPYSGGGERPDCYSDDAVRGNGPQAEICGGFCVDCQLSKFGSGENNSQACDQKKRIFLLRENEMLPTIVDLTPINAKALKKYGVKLMNKRGKLLCEVVSKLENSQDVSKSGFPYAKVTISLESEMPADEAEGMKKYADSMKPVLEAVSVRDDVQEVAVEEDDEEGTPAAQPVPPPAAGFEDGPLPDVEF